MPTHSPKRGEYRKACAELGLVFVVARTTSPTRPRRPLLSPAGAYDFGLGAGFYGRRHAAAHTREIPDVELRDANELPELVVANFRSNETSRHSILGHRWAGTAPVRSPSSHPASLPRASTAFSPIRRALTSPLGDQGACGYLVDNRKQAQAMMQSALIGMGARFLIFWSIGNADPFPERTASPNYFNVPAPRRVISLGSVFRG